MGTVNLIVFLEQMFMLCSR